jgi:formate dehydrogenase major subunit
MTNHWIDIRNADRILIIGSNAAENHPICMKYVLEAQDKGAKVIHVDPRYSRTSSKADMFIRIRTGTDIAFMGGMIYHILEDMRKDPGKYNLKYVQQYTNAAYIINPGIKLPGDADQNGLFSVWDSTNKKYDAATWKYANTSSATAEARLLTPNWEGWTSRAAAEETAWAELDNNCVLKLLWRNYRRYDKATVSRITGIPVDKLEAVYAEYARTGATGKAGTIMYAMGATQHTYGSQNIRAYSVVQLLLGNIGVAGGGINALRGTSNVQGSTDQALLEQYLPGYLKTPTDASNQQQLGSASTPDTYLSAVTPVATNPPGDLAGDNPVNWWKNTPKYVHSLLKAWWPNIDLAVSYNYLPKKKASGVNYTHMGLIQAIGDEKIEGLWIWGQNPAAGGPTSLGARDALKKLKWMVASDIWFNETHTFWEPKDPDDEESECKGIPGVKTKDIQTEVFLLPAAGSFEKEGSVSNSGRWVQWRYRAVEPPEKAIPDLDMMIRLFKGIRKLYDDEVKDGKPSVVPEPILNLSGFIPNTASETEYSDEEEADVIAREMNGYALVEFTTGTRTYKAGELIDWFNDLQTDGKTSAGNWLHCGQYNTASAADQANYPDLIRVVNRFPSMTGFPSINKAKKRGTVDTSLNQVGLYPDWSWCWPRNRRIIYNRAAVDLDGNPWDAEHPVLAWNGTTWVGDVVDGGGNPINLAAAGSQNLPFIMNVEGVGKLWGYGLKDGPIPEVYEPWESPLAANPLTGVPRNDDSPSTPGFHDPAAYIGSLKVDGKEWNQRGTVEEFPYVATTYRCTEHWQTGIMTRNLPWLAELMPEMYVEFGEDLALELGIASGDRVKVSSARGTIEALAVVTKRFQAITVDGKTIHQVGIPWHWGYAGRVTGDSGNVLTPHVGDANTSIPESKSFLCKIEKA